RITCFSARLKAGEERCANNLKQIGLAAMTYADDKRFFPHRAVMSRLDPGATSNTAPRCLRALLCFGYLEDPQVFVCPSSPDHAGRFEAPDRRLFCWTSGSPGAVPLGASPIYDTTGAGDRPLTAMTDLSYGWTMKGLCGASMSTNLVAGDKARLVPGRGDDPEREGNMRGNHAQRLNAVCLDAHVVRITPEGDEVTTHNVAETTQGGGYLGVLED
ncbi:MAG TPA: DUF1559 domain-containing protein, partial [Planctomycetota bacterium]|nr:DUF1559 domain-containing protein [Planctomycetota bacterium]